ncbi:Glycine betaine/carnitine/choline transport ATP-binding protein OpuCA [Enhygromyxa salina]|uniref:Glycine betaine/carnitine/choline transport ATP-binding protein OpuCA n=1 Tax=Enhygromyxa salina TaxID=215803 RepID=A0A2S9XGS5_9BACT|nr:ABC transporter ATP-binding protein [Enhygromyxa salina]PRP92069.1 Glycine betaine/carnitine/choline transport ATP-binding protein OpuCA [Enhygromyxa salina]
MSPRPELALELDAVSCRFGEVLAVDEVSLALAPGELVVLVGGSGSGKTTTLKLINRLIEASGGRVRLAGEDTAKIPGHLLRRRIGYVFQGVGLFPHMRVGENVGVTPGLLGWDPERTRARVDAMLELVELPAADYRERWPHELSGGQAQRVGVARALAAEPELILLDEPFGALDPLTRLRLQARLQAIRAELELSAVFVTHDMHEALTLGDRVAVMHEGRLQQLATPTELLRAPANDYVAAMMETVASAASLIEGLAAEAGAEARS